MLYTQGTLLLFLTATQSFVTYCIFIISAIAGILLKPRFPLFCSVLFVTAAWSLQLTKLYAALNSVLGTADRYRTLLTSKIKRTVSWLSRIQWSRIALLPCLLTRPTLHRLRVTNLVALSLWRKVEKRWRNELRIEMVLRPNLTTAIQSLKSLSNNGINVVYNSTVNIRRRQVEICGINKWHLSE